MIRGRSITCKNGPQWVRQHEDQQSEVLSFLYTHAGEEGLSLWESEPSQCLPVGENTKHEQRNV